MGGFVFCLRLCGYSFDCTHILLFYGRERIALPHVFDAIVAIATTAEVCY